MTDKEAERLIRKSVRGALTDYFGFVGVILIAVIMIFDWLTPYDDTDPPGGRSKMEVRTDCKTGLQYLATANGGLTPRLDQTGAQLAKDCK